MSLSMNLEPSPRLHRLALDIYESRTAEDASAQYNEVLNRVETHPRETKYRCSKDGTTALHWILSTNEDNGIAYPPLIVVKAAVDAYPNSLSVKDNMGLTPYDKAMERKARHGDKDYEEMMSFLKDRHTKMVRGALHNVFAVRDSVETLENQFKQMARDNANLSSQMKCVLETCGDLQNDNSDLKTKLDFVVKESRKEEVEKHNLGVRDKETLTNLIRAIETLRTDVGELQSNVSKDKQANEYSTELNSQSTSHTVITPNQEISSFDVVTPPKVEENTQISNDVSNLTSQIDCVMVTCGILQKENSDLRSKFKIFAEEGQSTRDNANLSSQINCVMETCGDLQKENADLKTSLDFVVQENRKIEDGKRNLSTIGNESLTNLIKTVEVLRHDMCELQSTVVERKLQQDDDPELDFQTASHNAITPNQEISSYDVVVPTQLEDNAHITKDVSNLSYKVDCVMETCGDLQRHNSERKTEFTTFLKEYRKVEIDKRNLGAREKETLTNLIRTVEALRTHVKELQPTEKGKSPEPLSQMTTPIAAAPNQTNSSDGINPPPKLEDNAHIIRDLSSQFKSMQVQMNDFEEERDNADLERRELFGNLKKVVNSQEKMEKQLNDQHALSEESDGFDSFVTDRQKKMEGKLVSETLKEYSNGFDTRFERLTNICFRLQNDIVAMKAIDQRTIKSEQCILELEKQVAQFETKVYTTPGDTAKGQRTNEVDGTVEAEKQISVVEQHDLLKSLEEMKRLRGLVESMISALVARDADRVSKETKLLDRQISSLKAERLVLLRFKGGDKFEINSLRDENDTMKLRQENLEHGLMEIKSEIKSLRHSLQGGINGLAEPTEKSPRRNSAEKSFVLEETHANEKYVAGNGMENQEKFLERLMMEKENLQNEQSYWKAERIVLLNYRHASELERKKMWKEIKTVNKKQNQLKKDIEKAKVRKNRVAPVGYSKYGEGSNVEEKSYQMPLSRNKHESNRYNLPRIEKEKIYAAVPTKYSGTKNEKSISFKLPQSNMRSGDNSARTVDNRIMLKPVNNHFSESDKTKLKRSHHWDDNDDMSVRSKVSLRTELTSLQTPLTRCESSTTAIPGHEGSNYTIRHLSEGTTDMMMSRTLIDKKGMRNRYNAT